MKKLFFLAIIAFTINSLYSQIQVGSNNLVGIGAVTTPAYNLDIAGSVQITQAVEADIHYQNGSGQWEVGSNNSGNGTSGNHFFIYDNNYRFTVQRNSGYIGMNTNLPQTNLHVKYNPNINQYAILRLESGGTGQNASTQYVTGNTLRWELGTGISAGTTFELYDRVNSLTSFAVKDNGFTGIGTNSPISKLHVSGDTYIPNDQSYWIGSNSDNGSRLRLHSTSSLQVIDYYPSLYFRTGASNVTSTPLFLKSNGYVGVFNNTNPQYALDVNGLVRATNISVSSDSRLKENIKSLNNPLDSILLLKGVSYTLKKPEKTSKTVRNISLSNSRDSLKHSTDTVGMNPPPIIDSTLYNRSHIGFLAQDVQKIYPQLVYEDKNGILSVDYISMIPLLVEAIKKQQIIINEQKQKIQEMDMRIAKLEKKKN
jgi:hypothetical protein